MYQPVNIWIRFISTDLSEDKITRYMYKKINSTNFHIVTTTLLFSSLTTTRNLCLQYNDINNLIILPQK